MSQSTLTRLLLMLMTYIILKFFGGSLGALVLYPVTLLVTFLHEFGHALGGILTGAGVEGMQINPDGSGYTITRGGNTAIILVGGYIGSAVLGNILLYIGIRKRQWAQIALVSIAGAMLLAAIVWFESLQSSGILAAFALVLYLIAQKTNWDADVVAFFGLAAVLYIIQDFRVGPGSDLQMYEQTVGLFPSQVWMYIWLGIVLSITYLNIRRIFGRRMNIKA
jgi:hypothetical protein